MIICQCWSAVVAGRLSTPWGAFSVSDVVTMEIVTTIAGWRVWDPCSPSPLQPAGGPPDRLLSL